MSAWTTYRVEDDRGTVDYVEDTDRAERLSREVFRVTATTERAP